MLKKMISYGRILPITVVLSICSCNGITIIDDYYEDAFALSSNEYPSIETYDDYQYQDNHHNYRTDDDIHSYDDDPVYGHHPSYQNHHDDDTITLRHVRESSRLPHGLPHQHSGYKYPPQHSILEQGPKIMHHPSLQYDSYKPEQSYHPPEPKNNYQKPHQSYQKPHQSYQKPHQSYQKPQSKYEPKQKYAEPSQKYKLPAQSYHKPSKNYRLPAQKYQEPIQKHALSPQTYHEPTLPHHKPSNQYNHPQIPKHTPHHPKPAPSYRHQHKIHEPSLSYNGPRNFQKISGPRHQQFKPDIHKPTQHYLPQPVHKPKHEPHYQPHKEPVHHQPPHHHYDPYYYEQGIPYQFQYGVHDEKHDTQFGHEEKSTGKEVKGQYHVLLPDGRRQVVTYSAGPKTGFVAHVEYEYVGFNPLYEPHDDYRPYAPEHHY